jgi:hypothetical protein
MAFDLAFLLLLATSSAGLGLRIARRFGETPDAWPDVPALALPLGLGAVSLGMFGLGEFRWMTPAGVAVWLGIVALAGLPEAFRHLPGLLRNLRASQWSWCWDGPLAVALIGTLLTALAPVTDGDALCYHLQVPKVFLTSGFMGFDPDLHETVYPLLTELLYAAALAVRGPVACRLVQWLLGVSFAMSVAALARPVLGARSRWAATIALLVPAVSNGMGSPLNDVALAAFGNAALVAWMRWNDRPTGWAAALAGVLAGLAMGVKYPAIVLTGLIAVAMAAVYGFQLWGLVRRDGWHRWLAHQCRQGLRRTGGRATCATRKFRQTSLFLGVALLIGGVWYARAYAYTGNPVYPFFRHVFGGSGLDEVLDPIKRPLPATPWNLATALVPMTLQPARFDSVSHQFGPLFLLVLPALLWERAPRRVWAIVAIGYVFLTLCLTQRQSMRFVLIAVGPLAVGVAWVVSRWWDRRVLPSKLLAILLVGCLGFEATIAAGRARHGLNVLLGRELASDYLTRREPTYRVGRWIDCHLPPTARLIGQDHRGFYIPRGYTMELAHRRRTGLGRSGESPEAIVIKLRGEGFTHLLLCPPEPEDAVEFDPTLGRLLAPWLSRGESLYSERIVDPDGVARRYAIYSLDAPPIATLAGGEETQR